MVFKVPPNRNHAVIPWKSWGRYCKASRSSGRGKKNMWKPGMHVCWKFKNQGATKRITSRQCRRLCQRQSVTVIHNKNTYSLCKPLLVKRKYFIGFFLKPEIFPPDLSTLQDQSQRDFYCIQIQYFCCIQNWGLAGFFPNIYFNNFYTPNHLHTWYRWFLDSGR